MNQDFVDLLNILKAHEVEFLVVGSYVLAFYGRPRYTEDVDIWIRRTRTNVEKLANALTEFGALVDRTRLMALAEEHDKMVVIGAAPNAVDILNTIAGLDFEGAWKNRNTGELFGSEVNVLSKEDFIASKRAAGRKKDLLDLAILEEVDNA